MGVPLWKPPFMVISKKSMFTERLQISRNIWDDLSSREGIEAARIVDEVGESDGVEERVCRETICF